MRQQDDIESVATPDLEQDKRPAALEGATVGSAATRTEVGRTPGTGRRVLATVLGSRPLLLAILTLLLIAYMTSRFPTQFSTWSNAKAVLLDSSVSAILVIGMMILMIGGTFDLSIGGMLVLTSIVTATMIANYQWAIPGAIVLGLGVGALCGLINGLLVTRIKINALIATLAMAGVYTGVAQLVASSGITPISDSYSNIGGTLILGLQSPVWIAAILVAIMAVAVSQTRFFRQYYFIGGSEKAARLSGIAATRLIVLAFIAMGMLAALAGIVNSSRLNAATVTAGTGLELATITAAVLGGASLRGGEGTVIGGVLGVVFISLVNNSLIILGVDVFWQQIVIGLVLVFAVSLDRLRHTRLATTG